MSDRLHQDPPGAVLGFDFGMKHIGVAVGQSITRSATPLKSLNAKDGIPDWDAIQSLIDEWRPSALIVGLPLTMDGSEQPISFAARRFMNRLKERFQLPAFEVDERLSSWAAKDEMGTSAPRTAKKRRAARDKIHAVAAALLIEQWYAQAL